MRLSELRDASLTRLRQGLGRTRVSVNLKIETTEIRLRNGHELILVESISQNGLQSWPWVFASSTWHLRSPYGLPAGVRGRWFLPPGLPRVGGHPRALPAVLATGLAPLLATGQRLTVCC